MKDTAERGKEPRLTDWADDLDLDRRRSSNPEKIVADMTDPLIAAAREEIGKIDVTPYKNRAASVD